MSLPPTLFPFSISSRDTQNVARYIWSIVSCSFCLTSVPSSFDDLPRWLDTFKIKERFVVSSGVAALIWAIWKTRNDACFNGVFPQDPVNVIFLVSHFVSYWAGLQRTDLRKMQRKGARLLLLVAAEFFHQRRGWGPMVLRLTS